MDFRKEIKQNKQSKEETAQKVLGRIMRNVIIESPYAADSVEELELNIAYARAALKDSMDHDEAPLASHLLYTQPGVLDDDIPAERKQGIEAGLSWRIAADATIVYQDLGISHGMKLGCQLAEDSGNPVEYRNLPAKIMESLAERFPDFKDKLLKSKAA